MSKGLELIGSFNSEGRGDVDEIKELSSKLIDLIDQACPDGRRKSIALTNIETAQMFAVKSLFSE